MKHEQFHKHIQQHYLLTSHVREIHSTDNNNIHTFRCNVVRQRHTAAMSKSRDVKSTGFDKHSTTTTMNPTWHVFPQTQCLDPLWFSSQRESDLLRSSSGKWRHEHKNETIRHENITKSRYRPHKIWSIQDISYHHKTNRRLLWMSHDDQDWSIQDTIKHAELSHSTQGHSQAIFSRIASVGYSPMQSEPRASGWSCWLFSLHPDMQNYSGPLIQKTSTHL